MAFGIERVRRFWLAACPILCLACSPRTSGEEFYQRALHSLRNGKASQALQLARDAEGRCPAGSGCRWKARLLEAEALLSDGQLEAASTILSERGPGPKNFAALEARRVMLQGALYVTQGNFENAEKTLHEAERLAMSAGAWEVSVAAETWEGQLLFRLGRSAEAEAVFQQARAQASARRDLYNDAIALIGIGMIRLKQSHFDEAIPWFQRSIDEGRAVGAQRIIAAASINLGICYSRLGEFDEALVTLRHALDLLGEGGLTRYRMNILGEMGSTYFLEGDVRQALSFHRQALALATTDEDRALWNRDLTAGFVRIQNWDEAERSNEEAIRRAHDVHSQAWYRQYAAEIAAGRRKYAEALGLFRGALEIANDPIVTWECHAGLAKTYIELGDYSHANKEFEKTIDIIDSNVDRLTRDDYKFTFFSLLIGFYQSYVRALVRQHAYERALEVADSSRARILFERLALKRNPRRVSSRDYQEIARVSGGTLLFYWVAPEQSYLWVVAPTRVYPPFELPGTDQIQQWVDGYRTLIERLGDPLTSQSEAGRRLYEALVAPASGLLPHGSRIIVSPDGPLHWLNFETLPVYGKTAGEKPHYWIQDVHLGVAPSLSILGMERKPKPRTHSLLIIGDPVSPGPAFPKLAYAAQEIDRISEKFPAAERAAFTGPEARPSVYQQVRPARFSVLHFSAHAVGNQQSPLDSAIILSPEGENFRLYARMIMKVPLDADLVTISACRSAGARSYSGEGLVGFAWAFLEAGARNVIAGLWDVTDSSTPGIMDGLYSRIEAGEAPIDALREAKLNLVDSRGAYRKPYYWGPFQLYTR